MKWHDMKENAMNEGMNKRMKWINEWMPDMKWHEMTWNDMKWHDMKWNEMNEWKNEWNEMKWNKEWMNEWKWHGMEWNGMNERSQENEALASARIERVAYGFCSEWVTEWKKEWRKEGTNRWTEWMIACEIELATVSRTFYRPHRPKVLRPWQFFFKTILCDQLLQWCGWHMKSGSCYSLVHHFSFQLFVNINWTSNSYHYSKLSKLLPTSSSKSAPVPSVLLQCHVISYLMMMMMWLSWNWALATVLCAFCRPHLPKVLRALQFFNILKWKSSFRYSLVRLFKTSSSKSAPDPTAFYDFYVKSSSRYRVMRAFCRPISPIEPRNRGNRDLPSATTAATLPEKNTGFRARQCFQAWIHAFPTSHTSQLLAWWCGDWGDDVVAIMVRTLAIVRNSEVS